MITPVLGLIIVVLAVVLYRLHPTGDRIRMHKNRLRINELTASDNGVFDCRARNLAAAVNSSNSYLLSVPGIQYASLCVKVLLLASILLGVRVYALHFVCLSRRGLISVTYICFEPLHVLNRLGCLLNTQSATLVFRPGTCKAYSFSVPPRVEG